MAKKRGRAMRRTRDEADLDETTNEDTHAPQAPRTPRKKRKTSARDNEIPSEPVMILELAIPIPQFDLVLAEDQAAPSSQWLKSLRDKARSALDNGQALPAPSPEYSPFFSNMKGDLAALDARTETSKLDLKGDKSPLLRTKNAGMWWRDPDHQTVSEFRTRQWASGSR